MSNSGMTGDHAPSNASSMTVSFKGVVLARSGSDSEVVFSGSEVVSNGSEVVFNGSEVVLRTRVVFWARVVNGNVVVLMFIISRVKS